jgi:hypothetical protein
MILHMVGPYGPWYEVANPQAIRSRIELVNSFPLQLLIQTRRTRLVPLFKRTPQQSDYTSRWVEQSPDKKNPFAPSRPELAKILPGAARLAHVVKIGWHMWQSHSLRNRKNFRPVKKGWSK